MKKALKWKPWLLAGAVCGLLGVAGVGRWFGLSESLILFLLPALPCLVIGLVLLVIQDVRNKKAAKEAEAAAKAAAREREAEEARAALARKKYLTVECKVAGVTYNNDDGSSRQRILAKAMNAEDDGVTLKRYTYKGQDAIHVLWNGQCVGNVPAQDVGRVIAAMEDLDAAWLKVESFVSRDRDDDEGTVTRHKIYRADLVVQYLNPDYQGED